ncbi:PAS domain-containing protein [Rhodopseudomonas palustris]|uniref:HWE histidine kinase domain-containing protein n=1 Tax=Rhodopseudomonas palustris TaxID=1076 RepID=UPI0020CDA83D|nr:HWE histidine kinase domain-containing protein [Rhodopseudomonas palustris]MCP9629389.1 PAS domain-containing protein [Rhodopseudomonas palustris]
MRMDDLYRMLRTTHVQAQGVVDTVSNPMLVLDAGLHVLNASRAFLETFKVDRDETIGRPLYELGDGQWDIPDLRRLLLDVLPKAETVINYKVEHDFPGIGRRTMLLTARTLSHPDNASHSMLLSIVDDTERSQRDAAKDMLLGELRHRMKNLLGIAQSMAHQTRTEGRSAEQYRDDFLGRFGALVEAENLAFAAQNEAGILTLFERILAPYWTDRDPITIEPGPPVELEPRTLVSLSLVFHELATNAVKYGSLSVPEGRVRVGWQVDEANNEVRFDWVERGGPAATPPTRTGFGTQLIRSTISYNLGGRVDLDFGADGLTARIAISLRSA